MLPFLKPKKLATTILVNKKESKPEGEHSAERMTASERLIQAIHGKDAGAVADILSSLSAPGGQSEE